MQFERPHHQRIAHVLSALDGATLCQYGCLFGGGTCIALLCGEYRESIDIDFLVSDAAGYRCEERNLRCHLFANLGCLNQSPPSK